MDVIDIVRGNETGPRWAYRDILEISTLSFRNRLLPRKLPPGAYRKYQKVSSTARARGNVSYSFDTASILGRANFKAPYVSPIYRYRYLLSSAVSVSYSAERKNLIPSSFGSFMQMVEKIWREIRSEESPWGSVEYRNKYFYRNPIEQMRGSIGETETITFPTLHRSRLSTLVAARFPVKLPVQWNSRATRS